MNHTPTSHAAQAGIDLDSLTRYDYVPGEAGRMIIDADDNGAYVLRSDVESLLARNAACAAPTADEKYLPGWERGIATVTMTGHQLREALDFINPDGDDDEDQRDNDLTFGIVQHKDDNGAVATGLCCWNDDTDGVLPLDAYPDALAASPAPETAQADDVAVDRFAAEMKAKMAKKRAEGRNGWDNPDLCSAESLNAMLTDHLAKGDPVDVGNFAMMLWNRRESTSAPVVVRRDASGLIPLQALHDIIEPYAHSIIKRGFTKDEQDERLRAVANWIEAVFDQFESPSAATGKAAAENAGDPNELHFNSTRLRNVARLVGMENAVPEDDETLDGARGSVLGLIAGKLHTMLATSAADAKDAAAYRFWRDSVLAEDESFVQAVIDAMPNGQSDAPPSADEWDAAIAAVMCDRAAIAASQKGTEA